MFIGHARWGVLAEFGLIAAPRVASRSLVDVTGSPLSSNHCARMLGRWWTSLLMKTVRNVHNEPHCYHVWFDLGPTFLVIRPLPVEPQLMVLSYYMCFAVCFLPDLWHDPSIRHPDSHMIYICLKCECDGFQDVTIKSRRNRNLDRSY